MKHATPLILAAAAVLALPGCDTVQETMRDLDIELPGTAQAPTPESSGGAVPGVLNPPSGGTDTPSTPQTSSPRELALAWDEIELDGLEPQYPALFRLLVAENLESVRQNPEAFAAQHYIFFELPVVKKTTPGRPENDVAEWEEAERQLSNEFGSREVADAAVAALLQSLDDYDPETVTREFVVSSRATIQAYDFDARSFPIRVSALNNGYSVMRFADSQNETPLRANNVSSVTLADGGKVSVYYAPIQGAMNLALGGRGEPSVFQQNNRLTFYVPPVDTLLSLPMDDNDARALRESMGASDQATWRIRIRVTDVELNREIVERREGRGFDTVETAVYTAGALQAEVVGGRLTYLDRTSREHVTITTFGDAPPE